MSSTVVYAHNSYSGDTPLPYASQLHDWLNDSLQRQAAPGDKYQADIEPILPVNAGTFFSFHATADHTTTAKLQHSLNAKANLHIVKAAVQRMKPLKEQSRKGEKWEWPHHKAITAKGAWGWKIVSPESPQQCLSDTEYALAARLNLGVDPFPARARALLPSSCPLYTHRITAEPVSLAADPWHWLTCPRLSKGELSRRHDSVVDATARVAWQVGAQVQREVEGLDPNSRLRPDLQIGESPTLAAARADRH